MRSPKKSAPAPDVKRTFSSEPKTMGFGRKKAPNHYTFNDNRVSEIERENQALANRLARVGTTKSAVASAQGGGGGFEGPSHLRAASVAPASINRQALILLPPRCLLIVYRFTRTH
jgi:hypothetical protein